MSERSLANLTHPDSSSVVIPWSKQELKILADGYRDGLKVDKIAEMLPGRTSGACKHMACKVKISRKYPRPKGKALRLPFNPDRSLVVPEVNFGGRFQNIEKWRLILESADWNFRDKSYERSKPEHQSSCGSSAAYTAGF